MSHVALEPDIVDMLKDTVHGVHYDITTEGSLFVIASHRTVSGEFSLSYRLYK